MTKHRPITILSLCFQKKKLGNSSNALNELNSSIHLHLFLQTRCLTDLSTKTSTSIKHKNIFYNISVRHALTIRMHQTPVFDQIEHDILRNVMFREIRRQHNVLTTRSVLTSECQVLHYKINSRLFPWEQIETTELVIWLLILFVLASDVKEKQKGWSGNELARSHTCHHMRKYFIAVRL